MRIRRLSSSTTAERCAGEQRTGSLRRSWSECPAASRRSAIHGTACRAKCCGRTPSAGRWYFRRTPRTPSDFLRAALRSNNPTIFFEHRHLLDGPWARRPYPGDDYVLPMGKAKITQSGDALTVVTWGAMVERCELAAKKVGESDRDHRFAHDLSVGQRRPFSIRCVALVAVSSCTRTESPPGFGAEVAAVVAQEAFFNLDAPIQRLAIPDVPVPHNFDLMDAVVPTVESIAERMTEVLEA